MGENTRVALGVIALVAVLTGIALISWKYQTGNAPIIYMVIAMVVSVMAMALAGLYVLNKSVKD